MADAAAVEVVPAGDAEAGPGAAEETSTKEELGPAEAEAAADSDTSEDEVVEAIQSQYDDDDEEEMEDEAANPSAAAAGDEQAVEKEVAAVVALVVAEIAAEETLEAADDTEATASSGITKEKQAADGADVQAAEVRQEAVDGAVAAALEQAMAKTTWQDSSPMTLPPFRFAGMEDVWVLLADSITSLTDPSRRITHKPHHAAAFHGGSEHRIIVSFFLFATSAKVREPHRPLRLPPSLALLSV